jgi:hypothetical protein
VMETDEVEDQQWPSRAVLREHPFHSDVPLLGPLIAWFRECWNSVSTRWYVRALIEQQNAFNAAVVTQLRTCEDRLLNLQGQIDVLKQTTDIEGWLIQQDRQQTALIHDLAELTAQLAMKGRALSDLEQRVVHLEGTQPPGQDAA